MLTSELVLNLYLLGEQIIFNVSLVIHRFMCSVNVVISNELVMKEKDARQSPAFRRQLPTQGARVTEILNILGIH